MIDESRAAPHLAPLEARAGAELAPAGARSSPHADCPICMGEPIGVLVFELIAWGCVLLGAPLVLALALYEIMQP